MQPLRDWLIVGGIFTAALVIGGWLVLRPFSRGPEFVGPKPTRLMPFTIAPNVPLMSAYQWLDEKTVLIHECAVDYAIDIASPGAKERSIPAGIAKASAKFGGKKVTTGMYGWVLSPDRKWALAAVALVPANAVLTDNGDSDDADGVSPFSSPGRWILTKLDGSRTFDLGPAGEMLDEPIWRPDSKGWFEIDQSKSMAPTVTEWAIDSPKPIRKSVEQVTENMSQFNVIGAISNASLLTKGDGTDAYNVVHFDQGRQITETTYDYAFGPSVAPLDHELSLDRKRIAWSDMSTPTLAGALTQSAMLHKTPFHLEIRVSNVDGTGMRLLANDSEDDAMTGPTSPRWMPDGKHISYIENGALWSAPVE